MAPTKTAGTPVLKVDDLKQLTSWMKEQKVRAFSYGRLRVEFDHSPDRPKAPQNAPKTEEEIREELRREMENDLFRSSGG